MSLRPTTYRLTLEALPSKGCGGRPAPTCPWGPSIVRVRRLLKYALRTHGLRCTLVEEIAPATQSTHTAQEEQADGPAARQT